MNQRQARIIAIEARSSRFGYALFEGPMKLIDWGAITVQLQSENRTATRDLHERVSGLIRRSRPSLVVVNHPRRTKTGKSASAGPICEAVVLEATQLGIPMQLIARDEVWRIFGRRNRDDIAEIIAAVFPELITRLPRRRKKWQPERRGMILFDAAAVGIAYWSSTGAQFPFRG